MDNDSIDEPNNGRNFDYYGHPIIDSYDSDVYSYSIPSRTPPSLTLDDLATDFNQDPEVPEVQGEGIAYQIHNVFANIRENMDEIFKTMGGRLTVFPLDLSKDSFFHCMNWSFKDFIVNDSEGIVYEKKVKEILDKLHLSTLIQPPRVPYDGLCDDIFTWQQFVMRQPQEFRTHYIRCFVEDTYHAYDGEDGLGISCVEGIYERILTSIGDACILYCTEFKKKNKKKRKTKKKTNGKSKSSTRSTSQAGGNYKSKFHKCENPVYKKLIKLFKKEIPDINELTKDWSKIFKDEFSASLTETQLKTNFIQFVNKKYTLYGLDKKAIVEKRANELEEAGIFANREFGS